MQEEKRNSAGNIRLEKKGSFLSLTEEEREELLQRNREARKREREEFIETYFASDMRYNIK